MSARVLLSHVMRVLHCPLAHCACGHRVRTCGNSSPAARGFAPYLRLTPAGASHLCGYLGQLNVPQKHVPCPLRCTSAQVHATPLLVSKSLLHSARNRLLAPREANQIKQSGKADSLFINLTSSPGD